MAFLSTRKEWVALADLMKKICAGIRSLSQKDFRIHIVNFLELIQSTFNLYQVSFLSDLWTFSAGHVKVS